MSRRHWQTALSDVSPIAVGVALAITAIVPRSLAAANTAPVAAADSYDSAPAETISVTLTATDADADPLVYVVTSLPTKGSLSAGGVALIAANLPYTIPAAGDTIVYTPINNAHGTDTFQFKANDGTADSVAATISIVLNRPPTVGMTSLTTLPNKDLSITLPVTDADADTLTFTITALPGHGRIRSGSTALSDSVMPYATSANSVTYTPDTDYHGGDTFLFTASDGYVTTSAIAVTIQINTAPVANGQRVTLLPGTSKSIELIATDADRDPIRYIIASLPAHGTLSVGDAVILESHLPKFLDEGVITVVYAVTDGYRGTDSFHFRVEDPVVGSDRAVVTIAVNTPPASLGSSVSGFRGTELTGVLTPSDADGDTVTIRLTALPEAGTLKINGAAAALTAVYSPSSTAADPFTFTFTPEAEWTGEEAFEWLASDGREDSTPAEVTITVIGIPSGGGGSNGGPGDGGSSGAGASCGSFGAGGMVLLSMGLLLAPARTLRLRFSRPLTDQIV
jgi:hypothetical protein